LAKQRLDDDPVTLDYLRGIESAVEQMENIFDFARTYELLGAEELSYANVENSINEAATLFSDLNGTKLMNECQGLTVLADSLLRQLFYNLIHNSLRYGEKLSQIRVYYEEAEEDQLKLIYEDDGVGIPEHEKEKIFKEGYGRGTGYGLYLIRKTCEVYGWTIHETGVPGKCAQFVMTIPKTNKNGKLSYRLDK
jgi:signal transduction histidine kinase